MRWRLEQSLQARRHVHRRSLQPERVHQANVRRQPALRSPSRGGREVGGRGAARPKALRRCRGHSVRLRREADAARPLTLEPTLSAFKSSCLGKSLGTQGESRARVTLPRCRPRRLARAMCSAQPPRQRSHPSGRPSRSITRSHRCGRSWCRSRGWGNPDPQPDRERRRRRRRRR